MGPPGAFATRPLLSAFCALVALAVVSINAYFLVLFRQEHLPPGAGGWVAGWLAPGCPLVAAPCLPGLWLPSAS